MRYDIYYIVATSAAPVEWFASHVIRRLLHSGHQCCASTAVMQYAVYYIVATSAAPVLQFAGYAIRHLLHSGH
jgi:hypothetical protein